MSAAGGPRTPMVDVVHEPGCLPAPVSTARVRALLRAATTRLSAPGGSIGVLFASDQKMHELNARYRRKDRPTDVLSFPAREPGDPRDGHLGDVAISCAACARQGRAARHGAAREAEFLLLHGLLHLLGYDHETDDGEMEFLEGTLRAALLSRPGGRR